MATYLDLISFTDQGIRKVKHSPQGAKAATCGGETWDQDPAEASGRCAELATVQAAHEQERREGPIDEAFHVCFSSFGAVAANARSGSSRCGSVRSDGSNPG